MPCLPAALRNSAATRPSSTAAFWTLALLLALFHAPTASAQTAGLHAVHKSDGVRVTQGDQPVLFYQRSVKDKHGRWPRNNYIHPLYDLHGNVISEDFPEDHGHHRGIFWAWHQVRVGAQKLGDAWTCDDFRWDVQCVESRARADRLSLHTTTLWKSPDYVDANGSMIPVVRECVQIVVHPAVDQQRIIDFDLSLTALVPEVRIGGSEDEKGYGGFSPRLKLSSEQRFIGQEGELQPTKTAIDAGPWVHLTGPTTSVLMIAHPDNPPPLGADRPEHWILRRQRSMQNPVYPGSTPVELSMTAPTRLRYRLVIHHDTLNEAEIARLARSW